MASGAFTYYYYRTIRTLVVSFAQLFNNTQLVKYNEAGTIELERLRVPIMYGGKEKWVDRIIQDPNLDKAVQYQLPRMAFEIKDLKYAADRKQISLTRRWAVNTSIAFAGSVQSQYIEVPYDMEFEVNILTRNVEDLFQILEQILPIFKPDYSLDVTFQTGIQIQKSIPVVLEDMTFTVDNEGDEKGDTRVVSATLKFRVKAFLFGPTSQTGVIQWANVSIYNTVQTNGLQVLQMASNGFSSFAIGDVAYQGNSLQEASALGSVVSWDSTNHKLYLRVQTGPFARNSVVHSANTGASWNLVSYYNSNGLPSANVYISPNPPTANANSNWKANVLVRETAT